MGFTNLIERCAKQMNGATGCCLLPMGDDCAAAILGEDKSLKGFRTDCPYVSEDDRTRVYAVLAEFLTAIREPAMVRQLEERICCNGPCEDQTWCRANDFCGEIELTAVLGALSREVDAWHRNSKG